LIKLALDPIYVNAFEKYKPKDLYITEWKIHQTLSCTLTCRSESRGRRDHTVSIPTITTGRLITKYTLSDLLKSIQTLQLTVSWIK